MVGLVLLAIAAVMSAAVSVEADPVTIRYAVVATPAEEVGYRAIVDAFNAAQEKVQVQIEVNAGGWDGHREKVLASIAGGLSPDVIRLDEELFPEFVSQGLLLPIDPYVARDGVNLRDYFVPALQVYNYNGKQYGFPLGIKVNAIAYNRDLFQEKGVAYPSESWRWSVELRQAAKKLTAPAESGRESWGMNTDWSLKHLADNIWSYGGDLFSSDFKRILIGEPAAVKALEEYWHLQFVDQVTPRGSGLSNFLAGKLGMWTTGAWEIVRLRNTPRIFDWDFALKPQGPVGRTQVVRGSAYVVSAATKNPEAAWEFVKFTTSLAGGEIALKHLVEGVPMHRRLAAAWNAQPKPPYRPEIFIQAIQTGRPYRVPAIINQIERAMDESGWNEMEKGNIPPKHMAEQVVPVVNALLAGQ